MIVQYRDSNDVTEFLKLSLNEIKILILKILNLIKLI